MEYYEVAAKWWADKVRNVGTTKKISNLFEKKLSEKIRENVEKVGCISFDCDYEPDHDLALIAREFGIKLTAFPWKTCMNVTKDKVRVKNGYGSSYITIFTKK